LGWDQQLTLMVTVGLCGVCGMGWLGRATSDKLAKMDSYRFPGRGQFLIKQQ
jgi:hypothetical protein